MAIWSDIVGVAKGYLILGNGGVRLKTSAGKLSIRTATDGADALVAMSSLATGTPDGTKFIRDDGTLAVAAILGANVFTGQQTFKEVKDTVYTITDGAAFEIDPANGSIQVVTLGASRSPLATNFEAGQIMLLGIDDGTAYSITWPSVTWVKSGGSGVAPTLATSGYTWVVLFKQGTTLFGSIVGSP